MKLVGENLENCADSESDTLKKDLFGRSAFNRYYYAAFLITREMLAYINPEWKKTPHKEIPNLLLIAVRKPAVQRLKQDAKKGLITKGELSAQQSRLNNATNELSVLLAQAYDVRVIADYEPEISISVENRNLMLNSYKLATANKWADRANAYCKDIIKVWKDTGLV